MATWLTHLRVAELIDNKLHIENAPLFFVGSIAPDNEFEADISHHCRNGDKATCDVNVFYRDYILNNEEPYTAFYIG